LREILRKTIPRNPTVYEENLFGERGNDFTRQDLFTHLAARKPREAFSSYESFIEKEGLMKLQFAWDFRLD
jgi:hypothetical protein